MSWIIINDRILVTYSTKKNITVAIIENNRESYSSNFAPYTKQMETYMHLSQTNSINPALRSNEAAQERGEGTSYAGREYDEYTRITFSI